MSLTLNSTTGLIIAAVLLFTVLCVNMEGFSIAGPNGGKGIKMRKKPSLAMKRKVPLDHKDPGDDGNIVYYGPVDANLLQITSVGRTY